MEEGIKLIDFETVDQMVQVHGRGFLSVNTLRMQFVDSGK
jgi:hypothetical protein